MSLVVVSRRKDLLPHGRLGLQHKWTHACDPFSARQVIAGFALSGNRIARRPAGYTRHKADQPGRDAGRKRPVSLRLYQAGLPGQFISDTPALEYPPPKTRRI